MYYLVTTTINIPHFLEDYLADFKLHNRPYLVVVVGDRKSPAATANYCAQFEQVVYLDIVQQGRLFKHLPLYHHLPFNSVQRRNLGYIYCLQHGLTNEDVVVTIDDDNFLKSPDYLGQHLAKNNLVAETLSSDQPVWYNPLCNFYLEPIVPRGYSFFHRSILSPAVIHTRDRLPLAVSAGLWEKNPDVDAITNFVGLPGPCLVTREEPLVLGKNILCPFNTQNTAYFSAFWLTAFLSPYLGRYDDIFSSFITKRIADHLGFGLSFGKPVVTQERNPHDLAQDLNQEIHGMSLTDSLVSYLYSFPLTSHSILDCYQQIADGIKKQFSQQSFGAALHHQIQPWSLAKMAEGMNLWLETLDTLNLDSVQLENTALHHANQ